MLSPKRVKFRKMQKGRRAGQATRGAEVAFGGWGLQAVESAWMTNRQIEAAASPSPVFIKRGGRSGSGSSRQAGDAQAAETRMGKGKGAPDGWSA